MQTAPEKEPIWCAASKVIPSADRRLMVGVSSGELGSYVFRSNGDWSSAIMNRIFGRSEWLAAVAWGNKLRVAAIAVMRKGWFSIIVIGFDKDWIPLAGWQ